MQLITLAANTADLHQFVLFWRALYQDPREHLYEQHIGPPSGVQGLQALFVWKNGGPLSRRKQHTLEKNFVPMPVLPRKEIRRS